MKRTEKQTENGKTGTWRPVLASLSVGLLIFLGVLVANSFWTVGPPDIFRLLSDACIAPAAFVGGVGVLVFAANGGTFDMLAYGAKQFLGHFLPKGRNERYHSFYEYKQAKGERRRPVVHMLVVGVAFFLLSGFFSFLWQKSF